MIEYNPTDHLGDGEQWCVQALWWMINEHKTTSNTFIFSKHKILIDFRAFFVDFVLILGPDKAFFGTDKGCDLR